MGDVRFKDKLGSVSASDMRAITVWHSQEWEMACGTQQVSARHGLSKVDGKHRFVPTQMTTEVKKILKMGDKS